MTKPIFARPRHEYQSYTDFWALVQLCDYPIVWQDEIDTQSDNTYIVVGPDASLTFSNAKARIIYWLLEWYGDYVQKEGISETWVSNETFAERIGAKFVVCGSHEGLGTLAKHPLLYDVAHMSYDGIHRRRLLLDKLKDSGVKIAPNGWGGERDKILRSSRAMLHIHQHQDYPAIAPLRIALAAAYGLPFIAESGWSTEPYRGLLINKYDNILTGINFLISSSDDIIRVDGMTLHNQLCHELRFDKCVEAAL